MWVRSAIAGAALVAGALPFAISCASGPAADQTTSNATPTNQTPTISTDAPTTTPTSQKPASVAQVSPPTSQPVAAKPALAPIAPPTLATTRPVDYAGLHNVVAYDMEIFSGSMPEGRAGFESLAAMGVRTIITVDGAAPDVATARQLGMRYVHLPIGYDGIDAERTLELARAVKDLPAPIYIHCHHGKHRSAAAASAALVTLGRMNNADAAARMKVSGTAASYTGLYKCVAVATAANALTLDAADASFPEVARTTGMVKTMVEIDLVTDQLKLIEKASWRAPADHPDLVPAAEAGRLADLMRVLVDDHDTAGRPPEFAAWLTESSAQAKLLEEALIAGNVATPQLSAHFATVTQSCKTCHVKYRD